MNKLSSLPSNVVVRRAALLAAVSLPLLACPAGAQSLWKESSATSLVADKRAHAVGDVLTILVQESNSAIKNNTTTTEKNTSLNAAISSFLYSPGASGLLTQKGQLPSAAYAYDHKFSGGGTINNAETITARIAVRVSEVLPNGNLVIEGTKKTSISGETQDAVLRGVVRQEDIASNNTIYSYNVSDASIKYVSHGTVADAQRKGWFTKILDKLTPF